MMETEKDIVPCALSPKVCNEVEVYMLSIEIFWSEGAYHIFSLWKEGYQPCTRYNLFHQIDKKKTDTQLIGFVV